MRPPPPIRPPVEHPRQPLLQAPHPRPLVPSPPIQLERLPAILLEHRGGNIRKRRIVDLLVGLQVPLEAPPIEVARPHRDPVVTDRHLPVKHARLKLEDTHAVAQQLAVKPPRGLSYPRMV